jgi:hypothetical protein
VVRADAAPVMLRLKKFQLRANSDGAAPVCPDFNEDHVTFDENLWRIKGIVRLPSDTAWSGTVYRDPGHRDL